MVDVWQQGEFGNPTGERMKVNALRKFCQGLSRQCVGVLQEIMMSPQAEEKNRLSIAKWFMEQAWGKSPQSMEFQITEGLSPNMMSTEQLNMYMAGKFEDLIVNLHQTGKLNEYLKSNQISLEAPTVETIEAPKGKSK